MPHVRNGFTLIEVLVALAIFGAALAAYGAATYGTLLTEGAKNDAVALSIAGNKLEALREGGFAALPSSGAFADPALSSLPGGSGAIAVEGWNPGVLRASVTVSWQEQKGPRSVVLSTLVTQGGVP